MLPDFILNSITEYKHLFFFISPILATLLAIALFYLFSAEIDFNEESNENSIIYNFIIQSFFGILPTIIIILWNRLFTLSGITSKEIYTFDIQIIFLKLIEYLF